MNQAKKPAQPVKKGGGCAWLIVVLMIGFGVLAAGVETDWFSSSDSDTTITAPTRQDSVDLAARLAEAEKAHGICYGWKLTDHDYGRVLSEGSSRGADVTASTCDRWVSLEVAIDYACGSCESEDTARFTVRSSADLAGNVPRTSDLERMGVTKEAAVDEPAATAGMGALALPLLMVEEGVAEPLPLPEPAGEPAVAISHPGSDFIGNNTGALVALGVIGGIAVLCLTVGLIVRKRGKEAR